MTKPGVAKYNRRTTLLQSADVHLPRPSGAAASCIRSSQALKSLAGPTHDRVCCNDALGQVMGCRDLAAGHLNADRREILLIA